ASPLEILRPQSQIIAAQGLACLARCNCGERRAPPPAISRGVNAAAPCRVSDAERTTAMLDVVMLAIAAGLFVVSIGYAYACDRL
ncbi:MAG: hypothetical protein WAU53_14525, partial [Rhodoplanes sp.]